MQVNHEELAWLIKKAYEKRLPLFIWGPPGIGKSQTVKRVAQEIAKEKGVRFSDDIRDINKEDVFILIDIRLSQLDPSDLRGLPKIDNGTTKWLPPNWLPQKGQGIIFADELNLAPPSVQAAAYQLILDRRLGDYVLPDGYVIIGAGNRAEDRANVFELPAPLKNRFIHVELAVPSVEDWTKWALENGIDNRIISFLNFRPSLLFKFDYESREPSFPTPRSWEFASKLIKGENDIEHIVTLVSSAVGEGAALEFEGFLRTRNLFNVDEILKDPMNAEIPEEPDKVYALIDVLVEKYDPKLANTYGLLLLHRIPPEFGALLMKMLLAKDKNFLEKLDEKLMNQLSNKFLDLLI